MTEIIVALITAIGAVMVALISNSDKNDNEDEVVIYPIDYDEDYYDDEDEVVLIYPTDYEDEYDEYSSGDSGF